MTQLYTLVRPVKLPPLVQLFSSRIQQFRREHTSFAASEDREPLLRGMVIESNFPPTVLRLVGKAECRTVENVTDVASFAPRCKLFVFVIGHSS